MSNRYARTIAVFLTVLWMVPGCRSSEDLRGSQGKGFFITFRSADRLVCCGLIRAADEEYLLVGRADWIPEGGTPWAAKVTRTGNLQWERQLPVGSTSAGLFAGAHAGADAAYGVGTRGGRALVMRLGRDGVIAWWKTLPLPHDARAMAATVSRDGTLVVAGITRGSGNIGEVLFVAGVSAEGETVWWADLGPGSDLVVLTEIQTGGYVVGGWSKVVRVGPGGDVLWTKRVNGLFGVTEAEDGDLIIGEWVAEAAGRGITLSAVRRTGEQRWRKTFVEPTWCLALRLWSAARGAIVVAGNLCDDAAQQWVAVFSSEGERGMVQRLFTRPGATALDIQPGPQGRIVATGMFLQDSPEERLGWMFMSAPLKLEPARLTR